MEWIKASVRLPGKDDVNGKLKGKPAIVHDWKLAKGYVTANGNLERVEDVEWLDESPTPAINEGNYDSRKDEHEQAVKRGGEKYADDYMEGYTDGYSAAKKEVDPNWKDKLAQDFGYKNLSDMDTSDRSMIEESEKRLKGEK